MDYKILLAFVTSVALSLIVTPFVIRFARFVGAVDKPDERKVHVRPMPRMGGVAIFISFFVTLAFVFSTEPTLRSTWIFQREGMLLSASLFFVLLLGAWDDMKSLGPGAKFLVQLVLSTGVYFAGFRISTITHPFAPGLLDLQVVDYFATVIWIVGITNAINLIDGLDGLASGVATIACLTVIPIALLKDDIGTAILSIILAGSLIGFLRYNFNPARVFLGDSGSLFIGFSLAVLSMRSSTKGTTAFAIVVPVLALGLPIMDTLLSMVRRFIKSVFHLEANAVPLGLRMKAMFLPDKAHIHHKLLAKGLSHRNVVLVLYLVSCILGVGAFSVTVLNNGYASWILLGVGAASVIAVRQLGYSEMALLRNGALLPLYNLRILNRDSFRMFLDLGFVFVAFNIAHLMTDWSNLGQPVSKDLILTLALVSAIKFSVFVASGLYKGSLRQLGLGDAIRITKAVTIAVVASAIVTVGTWNGAAITTMLLDFYVLLSLVLGSRFSFRVLRHLSRPDVQNAKRVLIYGAGAQGGFVLRQILEQRFGNITPIGFLDDNPDLEGKRLDGYTIHGGYWKLRQLLGTLAVDEIIVSNSNIRPEVWNRLKELSKLHRVAIRVLTVGLADLAVDAPPARQTVPSPAPATSGLHVASYNPAG